MTGERTDKALNGMLLFIAVLTAGSLIMLFIAVPAIFSSRNNSDAVKQGNELATCRSEFNAAIQLAQDGVEDARAERDNLVLNGLAASATGDKAALAAVADDKDDAIEAIRVARAIKTRAVEEYADAVTMSRMQPEQFLAKCTGDD